MQGNQYAEIEDLRCERLPENYDKQVLHKRLLKVIILGDTGKHIASLIIFSRNDKRKTFRHRKIMRSNKANQRLI